MAKEELPKTYNEYIFEIRYKPNPKLLDHRGRWAERIAEHMQLSEWRIVQNRVDVFDKDAENRAFVGFKNAGFISHDVPTVNYFPDKTVKFFKFVLGLEDFESPLLVTRIGVRLKAYAAFEGTFEQLRERYCTRYLSLTDRAKEILKAKVEDVGGVLNFADRHGNFNTTCGPMAEDQARQFLDRDGDLPDFGLYLDIDYWLKPEKLLEDVQILGLISTFSKEAWNKHLAINALILSD